MELQKKSSPFRFRGQNVKYDKASLLLSSANHSYFYNLSYLPGRGHPRDQEWDMSRAEDGWAAAQERVHSMTKAAGGAVCAPPIPGTPLDRGGGVGCAHCCHGLMRGKCVSGDMFVCFWRASLVVMPVLSVMVAVSALGCRWAKAVQAHGVHRPPPPALLWPLKFTYFELGWGT